MVEQINETRLLKAITIKRPSSFSEEELQKLINNYNVVIKDFNCKPPVDTFNYNDYKKCFKKIKTPNRVLYFHGVEIKLTIKELFWLRILLHEGGISEDDYNLVIFREGKCTNPSKKQDGDIKKFVNIFKRRVWEQIKEFSKKNPCKFKNKEVFDALFKELICYKRDFGHLYSLKTGYKITCL